MNEDEMNVLKVLNFVQKFCNDSFGSDEIRQTENEMTAILQWKSSIKVSISGQLKMAQHDFRFSIWQFVI